MDRTANIFVNEDILYIDEDYVEDCSNKLVFEKSITTHTTVSNEYIDIYDGKTVDIYKMGNKAVYLVIGKLGDYKLIQVPKLEKRIGYNPNTTVSYYKFVF